MKHRLLVIFWMLFAIGVVFAQDEPGVDLLFPDKSCGPSCWMGLIPGESTSADVKQFIRDHSLRDVEVYGLINEETENLITGVYEFIMFEWDFNTVAAQIRIHDSTVYTLVISIHSTVSFGNIPDTPIIEDGITINDVLQKLGESDHVYNYQGGVLSGHDEPYRTFIYLDPRLRVEFDDPVIGVSWTGKAENVLYVRKMIYFSPEAADEPTIHVGHDESQPALTALHLGETDTEKTASDNLITAPLEYVEPDSPQSLFDYDICAPPCWMGLTAGESTALDVANFMQTSQPLLWDWRVHPNSVVDKQTDLVVSGKYIADWVFNNRDDVTVFSGPVRISIEDGIVDDVVIIPNRTILLRTILKNLGTPDAIYITWSDVARAGLQLSYIDLKIHLYLNTISLCETLHLSNNFWVAQILYKARPDFYSGTRVPIDVWKAWLSGEVEGDCETIWLNVIDEADK